MNPKRDAYVEEIKEKLDEWNEEIDKIGARVDKSEAEAKAAYEKQLAELRRKRETVEENLQALRRKGGNAWEDLKAGVELASDALSESIKSAADRFK